MNIYTLEHLPAITMRPLTLCRERLARIQRILSMNAGSLSVREFARSFSVWEWEIEEAAAFDRYPRCRLPDSEEAVAFATATTAA